MTGEKEWFSSMVRRKISTIELADLLGVSRRTATKRLSEGLSSDELILVSRKLNLSPIHALVELGRLTHTEAFDYLGGDGLLLDAATPEQLIYKLAEDTLTPQAKIELGAYGRGQLTPTPNGQATDTDSGAPADDFDDEAIIARINAGVEQIAAQQATPPIEEHFT
jgi:hypothetical protein